MSLRLGPHGISCSARKASPGLARRDPRYSSRGAEPSPRPRVRWAAISSGLWSQRRVAKRLCAKVRASSYAARTPVPPLLDPGREAGRRQAVDKAP